ncbi:MAG: hypothetical protein KF762_09685 [Acidobacteria bacterium]|nr:hypothetical protein [Acidobacteriota bacterium]
MNDLDIEWENRIAAALAAARNAGREEIADYLRLRRANDMIRREGIDWLTGSFIRLATSRDAEAIGIGVERLDGHTFSLGRTNLTGVLVEIKHGVRCIKVEAGWTRAPGDGIMRGGALAMGRITHFGFPKSNAELALIRGEDSIFWTMAEEGTGTSKLDADAINRHFGLLRG